MTFWESVMGTVDVHLTSADTAGALRAIASANIPVHNVCSDGKLDVSFSVCRKDLRQLEKLTAQRGDHLELKAQKGIYWYISGLLGRPVLILGFLILFALSVWLPTRVLFVQVEGNSAVHSNLILEEAAKCGISFGASRRTVRSEAMKNALLQRMSQLQWAGVNTYGCVAVITVEERDQFPEEKESPHVSSIVAVRNGVIRSLTVGSGSACCKVGERVNAGQVLISGFTDHGSFVRATNANGEVFADTIRNLSALCLTDGLFRLAQEEISYSFGLIIGNNRINFNNSSGISDTGCVRIYMEKFITLPGGFQLPVAVYYEKRISYQTQSMLCETDEDFLRTCMKEYLLSDMIAGQIISATETLQETEACLRMDGIYGCCEMIGISRTEEYLLDYEDH